MGRRTLSLPPAQCPERTNVTLLAPSRQVRRVQPLTPQKGPDLAGSRAGIGLLHDPELVLSREPPPARLLNQLGVGSYLPDLAPSGRYALLAYGSLRSAAAGPFHLHR